MILKTHVTNKRKCGVERKHSYQQINLEIILHIRNHWGGQQKRGNKTDMKE